MVIVKFEEKQPFEEMSFLPARDTPRTLLTRACKLPIDQWFCDIKEKGDYRKLAFLCGNGARNKSFISFYYGFIRPPFPYKKGGSARGSGAPMNNTLWEFRVLHVLSNVPKAKGNWVRTDFQDSDFERIRDYQYNLGAGDHIDAVEVHKIIKLFNLKPAPSGILILNLCDKLLQGN